MAGVVASDPDEGDRLLDGGANAPRGGDFVEVIRGTPGSGVRTGHGTGELVLVLVFVPRRRTAIVRGRTVASVTRREWNEFAKQTEAK